MGISSVMSGLVKPFQKVYSEKLVMNSHTSNGKLASYVANVAGLKGAKGQIAHALEKLPSAARDELILTARKSNVEAIRNQTLAYGAIPGTIAAVGGTIRAMGIPGVPLALVQMKAGESLIESSLRKAANANKPLNDLLGKVLS